MAGFTVKRFIVVLVLVAISWNVITAIDEGVDNLYFKITGAKKEDPKHWFIVALIGVIVLAAILYFINMDVGGLLGVTFNSEMKVAI